MPSVGAEKVKGKGYTGESGSLGLSFFGKAIPRPGEVHFKTEHSKVFTLPGKVDPYDDEPVDLW